MAEMDFDLFSRFYSLKSSPTLADSLKSSPTLAEAVIVAAYVCHGMDVSDREAEGVVWVN